MNGSVSLEWHRDSWTYTCKRDDCLRNDEIRPAAANAAQRILLQCALAPHDLQPPSVLRGECEKCGLSRRTLQANLLRWAAAVRCHGYRIVSAGAPIGVRLSPELIHFLESDLVQLGTL